MSTLSDEAQLNETNRLRSALLPHEREIVIPSGFGLDIDIGLVFDQRKDGKTNPDDTGRAATFVYRAVAKALKQAVKDSKKKYRYVVVTSSIDSSGGV